MYFGICSLISELSSEVELDRAMSRSDFVTVIDSYCDSNTILRALPTAK